MSLYVAVVTDGIDRTSARPTVWGHLSTLPAKDPTGAAVDALVRGGEVEDLLVLAPNRLLHPAQVLASTTASTRPGVRIAVVGSHHSPWALGRVVDLLSGVRLPAPQVHAAVVALLSGVTSGAWLPSVAKLEHPAPRLSQHLRSLLPGGQGFLAVSGPAGWVDGLPLTAPDARPSLARMADADSTDGRPPRRELQGFSNAELPEQAIAALYALGLERRPQLHDHPGPASPEWPAAGAVEFLVAPADALHLGGAAAPAASCPACTRPVATRLCPFCHVVAVASTTPSGPVTVPTRTTGAAS